MWEGGWKIRGEGWGGEEGGGGEDEAQDIISIGSTGSRVSVCRQPPAGRCGGGRGSGIEEESIRGVNLSYSVSHR